VARRGQHLLISSTGQTGKEDGHKHTKRTELRFCGDFKANISRKEGRAESQTYIHCQASSCACAATLTRQRLPGCAHTVLRALTAATEDPPSPQP